MAVSAHPARIALVDASDRWTVSELSVLAAGGAGIIAGNDVEHVVYVGMGGAVLPLLIFASARAAVPFTPVNYRLSTQGVQELIARLPNPLVIVDGHYR